MTNEELVKLIQAGQRDALHVLWAQVERFAARKARQYITLTGSPEAELDDLYDSAYIALVYAAETYDPEREKTFIGWFALTLKTAFARATNRRSHKQAMDPLHRAGSLDAPLGYDESDLTLGDMVEDPYAAAAFESVEGKIWEGQLKGQLEKALEAIPPELAETVRDKYYLDRAVDIKAHSAAMRALRHPRISSELRRFIEARTDYYHHVGVEQFLQTGTSAVEEAVLYRERLARSEGAEHNGS